MDIEITGLQIDKLPMRHVVRYGDAEDTVEVVLVVHAQVVGHEQEIEEFTTGWYEPPKKHHIVTGQTVKLLAINVESVL